MEKKVELGIVGTGRIANRFVPEAHIIGKVQIAAVYNPHLESAEKFAISHKIPFYTDDYKEFLNTVHAVYIASPHETHFEYAKQALEKNKHVLCEKPMTLETGQASYLYRLAEKNGCVLLEGIKTLYSPGFRKLLELINSGTIGEIRDVEACFTKLVPSDGREMRPGKGGGSFAELGSYALCAIFSCLGEAYEEVNFESIRDENGVDSYTKAYFRYREAFATAKTGLGVKSEGELIISGTKGYILVKAPWWKTSEIEIRRENPKENEVFRIPFEGDGLRYELSEFVCQIEDGSAEKEKYEKMSVAIACCIEKFLNRKKIPLKVKAGATIYSSTGRIGFDKPDRMSSIHFYKAGAGSRLHLLDKNYYYNVATYAPRFDEKYIYTYDYEPEESWTTYRHDLYGDTYIQNDYIFHDTCYFRICFKRRDGKEFTAEEEKHIGTMIEFVSEEEVQTVKPYFMEEVWRTADEIAAQRKKDTLIFALLTDSHYTVNGTWEDTVENLCAVNERTGFHGIIHLGDWTDGMTPADITKDYVYKMKADLEKCDCPIFAALGNHDSNYFNGNPEQITFSEQVALYLPPDVEKPYYYKDFSENRLRCIFFASFDPREQVRYGFWQEELEWAEKVLEETPTNWCVLAFSHDAPLAELDYWADEIRNGERLTEILENYQDKTNGNLLAYIHGHTHADYIDNRRNFPIISVGCTKCESFPEFKPQGAVCYERRLGTVSQDLWDILLIDTDERKLEFVRFGAGENRSIQ